MLNVVCIFSLIAATIILSFKKWGLFERYQVHAPQWLPHEVCEFCVGFWISVNLTILYSIFFEPKIFYIAIPFACASLTLLIVKLCEK